MPKRPRFILPLIGIVLVLTMVLLNAWMSDDAYITFRTVFHFTEGHGPVYNVGERVQTYTNPLWMLVMSGAYAFTGEAYFTALVLSLFFCFAGLWLMQYRIFSGEWTGLAMLGLLVLSRSYVEYSTSGLENVLNGFLILLFCAVWLHDREGRKKLFTLALIAGFGMVSRMDTALLYAPAVFLMWWRMRSLRSLGTVMFGLLPFIAWEAFAVIYYGFPFPNTAYAKLNTGIPQRELLLHGWYYFQHTLERDPVTLASVLASFIVTPFLNRRRFAPLAIGMGLYLLYLLRVGGDFMGGRFFYLPMLLAVVLLGKCWQERKWVGWMVAALALLGLLNTRGPLYNWAREPLPRSERIDRHGIADERAWYQPASAWITLTDSAWGLQLEEQLDSRRNDPPNEQLLVWEFIGFVGYGAGPGMHVVDPLALADPLLARLPMAETEDWRIGHYPRVFPRQYRKSLKEKQNLLDDKKLHRYYGELCLITQGPLWTGKRWQAIIDLNLGKRDHWIDRKFYQNPSRMEAKLSELQHPHTPGDSFLAPGQIMIYDDRPLRIDLEGHRPFAKFEISLFGPNKYKLSFASGKDIVAHKIVFPKWGIGDELAVYQVETPPVALEAGFDAIIIESRVDNGYYSIGHLFPISE